MFLRVSYTTAVKVFPNPTSPSPTLRNDYTQIDGILGYAAEVQIPMNDEVSLSAAAEVMMHVDEGVRPIVLGGSLRRAPIRDGFMIVPVELGAVVRVPLGTESMHLTMGGGLGVTFGAAIREIAGVRAATDGLPVGYGIHVNVGFDAEVLNGVALHVAMRFRDPEVTLRSTYTEPRVTLDGVDYALPTTPLNTRVNADGFNIGAGIRIDLNRLFGNEEGT